MRNIYYYDFYDFISKTKQNGQEKKGNNQLHTFQPTVQ